MSEYIRLPVSGGEQISVRRLTAVDVLDLLGIGVSQPEFECAELPDSWKEEELRLWLQSEFDICLGAYDIGGQLVGDCLSHVHVEANKVHIENVFVTPKFRRKGIASGMLRILKNSYENAFPDKRFRLIGVVLCSNRKAIRTFEKAGFGIGEKCYWLQA
ncbi:MAG: GNAT family N-acetyltransferase [bacterium]|nr:GNAT family N-acetyltransferase [bacterium]